MVNRKLLLLTLGWCGCCGALLGPLGTILAAALRALIHAIGVQCAAHNVIAHTRQVFDTATAHQHHAVLLQLVAFARNISRHFNSISQSYASNFSQGGVWFLRCFSSYPYANSALERGFFFIAAGFQVIGNTKQGRRLTFVG